MRRPSHYVLLCAVLVLATFSASGHLAIGPVPRPAPVAPAVVRLEPPPKPPQMHLQGSVLDTMGFLLAGADVAVGEVRTRTDADGQFRIDLARAPSVEVQMSASGHRPASVRSWPMAREPLFAALEPAAPWDVQAAAATPSLAGAKPTSRAELLGEGFVRGPDGAPIAGALVMVAETSALARTDDAGRYEVVLPPTAATLLVHQPEGGVDDRGLCARSEPWTPTRTTGRLPLPDLVAGPAVVLRGTVRDGQGQPQKGVPLQIVGEGFVRTIASGESGTFRVAGLLPGRYRLRTFAFRGALGAERQLDVVAAVTDCDLHLKAVAERRLQIVTEQGTPVARAIVATSVEGLRREVVRSDDAGFVQVRAAESDASFDVRTDADYRPLRVLAAVAGEDRIVVALP